MNEGGLIPNITLRSVDSDGMQNFNLVERFQNKKVLIICVPGAFTSTCHNQHLPPYIQNCEILMTEKKIDMVCCITTNDPFTIHCLNAIKDVTGLEAKQDTGGGTSDARFMQRICPVFEFGTINKTLHKVNECVSISDLQTTEQIYYKTLENFFQS